MSSKTVHKPARNGSLATQLTVWNGLAASLTVLAVTVLSYVSLVGNLDREDDQFLRGRLQELQHLLTTDSDGVMEVHKRLELQPATEMRIVLRVLDQEREVVADSANALPIPWPADNGQGHEASGSDGVAWRVLALLIPAEMAHCGGWTVQAALDRTHEEAFLQRYRKQLALFVTLALIASVVGSRLIARRSLGPVGAMSNTAQSITASTLDRRIAIDDIPQELLGLATTFNSMLDRLEESFGRLSQFSADLAHELRSPIANLRGEWEIALSKSRSLGEYTELIGSGLEEIERISRMVESLLFIARCEDPQRELTKLPLTVADELHRLCEFYQPAAEEAGICLRIDCPAGLIVTASRDLLQRALSNLISNSLRHTSSGGSVTVVARNIPGGVQVEVRDSGVGISAEHLPRLFDRLYRADDSRSQTSGGLGLGLAIVKKIVVLHGGSISIESRVNDGTNVRITLPLQ